MPHFFFSYAIENAKGGYLNRFLDDLRNEVSELLPCTLKEACFYDAAQLPGEDYPVNIQQALATSRVMISNYSPNYFQKPYCGKEFAVFRDRIAIHRKNNPGSNPASIIPILWLPSAEHIPFTVRKFFVSRDPESLYEKEGLKYILEQGVDDGQRRAWYAQFKRAIARQIIETARNTPLAQLQNLNWGLQRNAFEPRKPRVVDNPADLRAGPKSATFLYVGDTRLGMDRGRSVRAAAAKHRGLRIRRGRGRQRGRAAAEDSI